MQQQPEKESEHGGAESLVPRARRHWRLVRKAVHTQSFADAIKPVDTALGQGIGKMIGLQDVTTGSMDVTREGGAHASSHSRHTFTTAAYVVAVAGLFVAAMILPNTLMGGSHLIVDWEGATGLAAKSSAWMMCRSVPCFVGVHWACVSRSSPYSLAS